MNHNSLCYGCLKKLNLSLFVIVQLIISIYYYNQIITKVSFCLLHGNRLYYMKKILEPIALCKQHVFQYKMIKDYLMKMAVYHILLRDIP